MQTPQEAGSTPMTVQVSFTGGTGRVSWVKWVRCNRNGSNGTAAASELCDLGQVV